MNVLSEILEFLWKHYFLASALIISGTLLIYQFFSAKFESLVIDTFSAVRIMNDQKTFLLDVREKKIFDLEHLPHARNISLRELPSRISEIPEKQTIIVYCDRGKDSIRGAGVLQKSARNNVFVLEGGILAWKSVGLPTK